MNKEVEESAQYFGMIWGVDFINSHPGFLKEFTEFIQSAIDSHTKELQLEVDRLRDEKTLLLADLKAVVWFLDKGHPITPGLPDKWRKDVEEVSNG